MNRINSSYLAYEFRRLVCVVLVRGAGGGAPRPAAATAATGLSRASEEREALAVKSGCDLSPGLCRAVGPRRSSARPHSLPPSCLLSLSTRPLTGPLRASVCFCICDPVPCPSARCQHQLSRLWAPGLPGADGPTSRGVTLVPLGPRLRFHQPLGCRPGPLGHLRAGRVLQAELAFPFFL